MSASTEKKLRQAAREAGTDKKSIAAAEKAKKEAETRRKWTVGTIIVAVLIVLTLVLSSGILFTRTTALTIGGVSYSPAEVTYCYGDEFWSLYSTYGSYLSYFYGIDTTDGIAGLSSQECSWLEDGGTWKDYFIQAAESTLQQVTELKAYADENGITLDEDEIQEIEDSLSSLEESVIEGGYKSLDNYFTANYGEGVTTKVVRKMAQLKTLASKAYEALEASFEYTSEELEEHYQSFAGSNDKFSYISYSVAAETVEVEVAATEDTEATTSSEVTEETLAAAKEQADEIAAAISGTDAEAFNAGLASIIEGAEGTESSGVSGSSLSSVYSEWMMDDSRKAGDVEVFENASASGYYVVMFLDRNDNHYNTVSMRHILISAEADEDGEYTDEALAAARTEAEEIYESWKSGEATEESFALLANEKSTDSGSNTEGGLYEDIYSGQMVTEIDTWLFDARTVGDTEIIDVVSSNYAGTHIVYFTGEGGLYSDYLAREDLVSADVEAWLEAADESYEIVHGGTYNLIAK